MALLLASASNAIIIAFNVRPDRNAEGIAARERVEIGFWEYSRAGIPVGLITIAIGVWMLR